MEYNDTKFTYIISGQVENVLSKHKRCELLKVEINHSEETDVLVYKTNQKEVAVIGLCIDSCAEIDRYDIPQAILSIEGEVNDVFTFCNRFAGKYVILYYDGKDGFLWGDATASLQTNYCNRVDYPLYIASTDTLIANCLHLEISEYSKKIRLGSDLSQAFPWDLTMFDEVKALLPNHYLCISERKSIRIPIDYNPITHFQDLFTIVNRSNTIVRNIVKEYAKYYEIVCPLTSGYDSRVVFSFLKLQNPQIHCYTFNHKGFNAQSGDLVVPREICNYYKQTYAVINDIDAPEDVMLHVQSLAGDYVDKSTVDLAYTYNSAFKGRALVNGDIIDQIGKSLIGNTIPAFLATPLYMQCKIHNIEKETRNEIRKHIQEMKKSEDKNTVFDLFAMENRCGRWAAQISTIYSICGITSLNIFNCRDLILQWVNIPRKTRREKWIHKQMLKTNDAHLLDFPFNPTDKYEFALHNWVLFYFATFLRQIITKFRTKVLGKSFD